MDLGQFGFAAAMALGAVGSGLGAGVAGMSAIGAWKKCFAQNRPAPFMLLAFVGAPLTQTIYGMILMNALRDAADAGRANPGKVFGIGLFGGLALGVSAWLQGAAGAAGADALAETGKGFGNYIIVLGLVETVAIFAMVFLLGQIG
jgi:V/A-type H+-transporting ATPase subunit K